MAVDPAASPTKRIGAFEPPLMRPKAEAMTDGRGREGPLRGLGARGLTGVKPIISDASVAWLRRSDRRCRGVAWQRCRTRHLRDLLPVPKSARPCATTLVRTIFDPPAAEDATSTPDHQRHRERRWSSCPVIEPVRAHGRPRCLGRAVTPSETFGTASTLEHPIPEASEARSSMRG